LFLLTSSIWGFTEYASVMVPVDIAAIIATLVMLHLFFRKDIPPTYDLNRLKEPALLSKTGDVQNWLDCINPSAGRFFCA
jgi:Na+/H+ antiporter NhaD/arsenite permease-like protein